MTACVPTAPARDDRDLNYSKVSLRSGWSGEWGGRGSHPRPADYEKHPRPPHALELQRCHEFFAMRAHMTLGILAAPVHAPVHTETLTWGQRGYSA
jgi:hypothetical protein